MVECPVKVIQCAAVVLIALLVALLPTLAGADARRSSDATADVQYYVNTDPSNVPPPVSAGLRNLGDIKAVRVGLSSTKVRVTLFFRSLSPSGQFQGHVFRFVAGGLVRKAQITAGPEEAHAWKGDALITTSSDRPVVCRGMKHRIDYAHEQVVLSVPSSCLRHPRSVRVGAGTVVLDRDRTYFDDGYRNRGEMGMSALTPTLGPAVSR